METEKSSEKCLENPICEEWRPIEGYEDLYEVSNLGRVRSRDRVAVRRKDGRTTIVPGRIMKCNHSGTYTTVGLNKDYHQRTFLVHRLVAKAFLPCGDGQSYINHLDNNPDNNRVDNLEWCTQSHNIQYAYDKGSKEGPHIRDVDQLTMDGTYIKTWHGVHAAGRELGIHGENISKVCKGERSQTGGYKWRYTV